jgi:hypothetical protein
VIETPGPMPTPQTEEPELHPGGADAIVDQGGPGAATDHPMGADLPAEDHPSADATPDEINEPDDKQQEPDGDDSEPEPPA